MKNWSGWMKAGAILFLLAIIVIMVVGSVLIYLNYASRQKATLLQQYSPPAVQVTDPLSEVSVAAGSYLNISATAMGISPIVRAELWLDGQLIDTLSADKPEGSSPFYADFAVLVPSEGLHMAFVRAVDGAGMIGQSAPVSLTGVPKPADPLWAVTADGGKTLLEIADAYQTSPEVLQGLNPGLGDTPSAGTTIKVPLPPKDEPKAGGSPALPVNPPVEIPDLPMLTLSDVQPINPFGGLTMPLALLPPIPPTGLQAEFMDCKIILRWNDNADNEDKYNVYLTSAEYENYKQTLLVASLKPSPKTGPAYYELETGIEGAVSMWVEAANSVGASPSNIVWVYVPFVSGCPSTAWKAQVLVITLLDISVSGNYDKAYCYVSFENQPEQRVPAYDGQFVQLVAGKSQNFFVGPFSLHPPSDEELDVSGRCLAWAGSTLSELGPFSGKFPVSTWNGKRQALKGNGYEMGLSLKACETAWCPADDLPTSTDPTLPVPYNVVEASPDNPNVGLHTEKLSWKWDGDLKKIDSFQIYLNGQPYEQPVSASWGFEHYVEQLRDCGTTVRWQVAAKKGTALSALSAPWIDNLPDCQRWLKVKFDSIYLIGTDDGWPSGGVAVLACETLDSYFWIGVGSVYRDFYGGGTFRPLKCGGYSFAELIDDFYNPAWVHPDVILMPISSSTFFPQNGNLIGIAVRSEFWDHDDWSSDDLIGTFTEYIYSPKLQNDGRWAECSHSVTTGDSVNDEATSHISFTYSFYPNKCEDIPPDLKDLYRYP